jgi:hypothetical protein
MKTQGIGAALVFALSVTCLTVAPQPKGTRRTETSFRDPIHVYCLCQNQWHNGRITNLAEVDVRRKTSFGPAIQDAVVSVNEQRLTFDRSRGTYHGDIGNLEQWQRIPMLIKTPDDQSVRGYLAVVYMVRVTRPAPWSPTPPSLEIPVTWEYSEGSMHTVDLVVTKGGKELRSFAVSGNSFTINGKTLGVNFLQGDEIQVHIHPPWTSNFEFKGFTTRRSKAEFVTTAVLSVRFSEE